MYCLLSLGLVLLWLLTDSAIRVMNKVKPFILFNVVHVYVLHYSMQICKFAKFTVGHCCSEISLSLTNN